MNRVTIVNLAGRAYYVDDEGAAAIATWLDAARDRLAADPDRDELLADFERAIAERCDSHLADERSVVTVEQAREVLAALGEVEPAAAAPGGDEATTPMPATVPADPDGWRERRLYRITGDDAMLAGVCAGLAAYLRVDVTVVRVAAVLLTLLTSGVAIVAYVVMALVVPEADSPDKRAAAYGYGSTAQEMISRARDGAGPAMASLGSLLGRTWNLFARVAHVLLIAAVWVLVTAWGAQVAWLWIDGGGLMSAFDDGTSTWLVALWVTCVAWIPIGLALALVGLLDLGRGDRRRRRDVAFASIWSAAMVCAMVGLVAIPAATSSSMRHVAHGSGRVELYGQEICFVSDPADRAACEPGDEVAELD